MSLDVAQPSRDQNEVLSVSALNRQVRLLLERSIPLIWVSGEVSNLTRAASGHVYFSLKDESAQVRCVMFRNRAQLLPFRLEEGMQVEARALVGLYEARGDFQLNIEALRPAGVGALHLAFARLKEALQREGLFDAALKRALPRFPRRIGVVTSLHAAALRDILVTLARRAASVPIIIYPTPVQGEGAGQHIAAALTQASQHAHCDVLIVARGGGSIEDLWAFNDEKVARAIRACGIPVVCGVGHETDTTIADFAADQRAATPTAAAELVSTGYVDAAQLCTRLERALSQAAHRHLETRMQKIDILARRLMHPGERIKHSRLALEQSRLRLRHACHKKLDGLTTQLERLAYRHMQNRPHLNRYADKLDNLAHRLQQSATQHLARLRQRTEALSDHLLHLNPELVLTRGYAIVRDAQGRILRDAAATHIGDTLQIKLAKGAIDVTVIQPNAQ